jgi:CRISPR-associated protein Csd2
MLNPTESIHHDNVSVLSARDPDCSGFFPAGFEDLYEVHSYRNAVRILKSACKTEFDELVETLMAFRIATEQMVKKGGNKSLIAKNIDDVMHPRGWAETRVQADLLIKQITAAPVARVMKSGVRKGQTVYENVKREEMSMLKGFIDGHKIDFIKGRVAFDLEWNSKDQTFDRDLYAARTFYECGVITAGVLLTRSSLLIPLFAEIGNRVNIPNYKSKFGASTTWMGKLTYRLDAGRGGGCPILALGIKPGVVDDFNAWKATHEVIREVDFEVSETDGASDEAEDES